MAWNYSLDMGIYVNWTEPENNRSRVTWYVNVYGAGVYYQDYATRGSITIQCRNNGVGSGAYFLHDNGTNLGTSWTPWSIWNSQTAMGGANYWNTIVSGSLWLYHGTRGYVEMVASATLIFYGLALINVSKFTFPEVHYLGITEIVLGLLAAMFLYKGIFFWTIGFGFCHILYGFIMYRKYDVKK